MGKQDELNFYIKSRDGENDRQLNVFLNQEPIIEMELADNAVEENYSIFRTKAPKDTERIVEVILEDSITQKIKIPSKGSYNIFIIANSTLWFRDYGNPRIYDHLKNRETSDFRGFADSLYDNGIIDQKHIQLYELNSSAAIEVSFDKINAPAK
ncbi:hypothetical protein GCM10007389_27830 [Pontibacter akesuensis]|nr:hypothetical protein GCM10007389_27830 [Pontibacter akesuensis]